MSCPRWSVLAALLAALACPPAVVLAQPEPPGRLVEERNLDVDGDGVPDRVALYELPARGAVRAFNLAVERAGRPASLLFGDGSGRPRPPELLGPAASAATPGILARPLEAAGSEVGLIIQRPDRQRVWLFRWTGTTFHLEASLEGRQAGLLAADASDPSPGLRQVREYEPWGGGRERFDAEEKFRWRDGAYRLTSRVITPIQAGAGGPLGMVLAYYDAVSRGDPQRADSLLTADDPWRGTLAGRVVWLEELSVDDRFGGEAADPPPVRVRVVLGQAGAGGGATETLAGTWRTIQDPFGAWRLAEPRLEPAPSLTTITAALQAGSTPVHVAQADLRGTGRVDLAVAHRPHGDAFGTVQLAVLAAGDSGYDLIDFGGLPDEQFVAPTFPTTLTLRDVTGDGRPEIVYGGGTGAHASTLTILSWDGLRFATQFAEASNTPGLGLVDLDGDGLPEIVSPVSGYCGSYAASPRLQFALRWRAGAYRPASADFPDLQGNRFAESIGELLAQATPRLGAGELAGFQACVNHLLATGLAFRGQPTDAWKAYQGYAEARSVTSSSPLGLLPAYVGDARFGADVRHTLERAETGQLGPWSGEQRAMLHDLLGNGLEALAALGARQAEQLAQAGQAEEASVEQARAAAARAAARAEYEHALGLSPGDREAAAGLARLRP